MQALPVRSGWMSPRILLRLEGAALLAVSVGLYARLGFSWLAFALLLFSPDLSMLGYAAGPRVGALVYNLFHTIALPLALAASAWLAGWSGGLLLALVWLAHIGLDRTLGYGFKLASGFKDTHLGSI